MTNENHDEHEGCNHTDEEHKQMYGDRLGGLLGMIHKLKEIAEITVDDGDPEIAALKDKMMSHQSDAAALLDRVMKADESKDNSVYFDPTLMAAVQLLLQKLVSAGVFEILDVVNLAKFASIVVSLTTATTKRVNGERDALETMLAGIEIDL